MFVVHVKLLAHFLWVNVKKLKRCIDFIKFKNIGRRKSKIKVVHVSMQHALKRMSVVHDLMCALLDNTLDVGL